MTRRVVSSLHCGAVDGMEAGSSERVRALRAALTRPLRASRFQEPIQESPERGTTLPALKNRVGVVRLSKAGIWGRCVGSDSAHLALVR